MITQTELFLQMLRGLRHALAGAVAQIDTILELAEQPLSEQQSTECTHPMPYRESRAVMGHATRFWCAKCKQEVEG